MSPPRSTDPRSPGAIDHEDISIINRICQRLYIIYKPFCSRWSARSRFCERHAVETPPGQKIAGGDAATLFRREAAHVAGFEPRPEHVGVTPLGFEHDTVPEGFGVIEVPAADTGVLRAAFLRGSRGDALTPAANQPSQLAGSLTAILVAPLPLLFYR
jgi:hypothetical protein